MCVMLFASLSKIPIALVMLAKDTGNDFVAKRMALNLVSSLYCQRFSLSQPPKRREKDLNLHRT